MTLRKKFRDIIRELIKDKSEGGISGFSVEEQFRREGDDVYDKCGKLNAAFLIKYSGKEHPLYGEAEGFIKELSADPRWSGITSFLNRAKDLIDDEIEECYGNSFGFRERFEDLHSRISRGPGDESRGEAAGLFGGLFFPEGIIKHDNINREIYTLRQKRKVVITSRNCSAISKPEREILFTSNALITLPPEPADIDHIDTTHSIREHLKKVKTEAQEYWYDHPVQIGVMPEHNEIIYGLENFDRALAFEEETGLKEKGSRVDFLLSVSVTHSGLREISRQYIENELKKNSRTSRMNIYVFTEEETRDIIDSVLVPAAERYLGIEDTGILHEILGVDGEYGRHYTFLKAVSALWNVFVSPETRGTFKIDLDQVFPQKELLDKTGSTAFGHLISDLWGANGTDSSGKPVHFGLIAGALVNERDMGKSLFTPDVPFPTGEASGDEIVFRSTLPQALSTAAEMQTRYSEEPGIDGINACIQRIHVTGGTNGILTESLRKYRPFTPSFIGRAEDQAYLMSVIFNEQDGGSLRYVHRDGLIMRHDKEAFASDSIKAAKTGKIIGDYARIILFSYYAGVLPWAVEDIKEAVDPFTGCFISAIPWTVVVLRLMLKTASLYESGSGKEGHDILRLGAERLGKLMDTIQSDGSFLSRRYKMERSGWDLYYDVLDLLEEKLKEEDPFAAGLRERAQMIVRECMLDI